MNCGECGTELVLDGCPFCKALRWLDAEQDWKCNTAGTHTPVSDEQGTYCKWCERAHTSTYGWIYPWNITGESAWLS